MKTMTAGLATLQEPLSAPAWARAAAIGFALFCAAALAAGLGGLLRLAFPAAAFGVGAYLYRKHPVQYASFSLWIWFLSPFARRVIDLQSGWVDPSPVLLAPVLVGAIAGAGFLRHALSSARIGGLPFVLAFAGTFYGIGVGLLRGGFDYKLAQPMLVWTTPLFLGFHLIRHWRDYPRYRQSLQTTFTAGALAMGAYGVLQFLLAPEWDRFWLLNVEFGSFGQPEPLGIRVFSTLNAPGPFSVVMMAALLILFSVRGWLRVPAAIGGYLSFLLCMTRSAWIGWAVGLIALLAGMEMRARLKVLAAIVALGAAVVPLAMMEPFRDVVQPRLESLTTPKDDLSLAARLEGYGRYLRDALDAPLGKGVGVMEREYAVAPDDEGIGPHDSALLELLLSLGFPGTIFYGGGLLALLFALRPRRGNRADGFAASTRAIGFGMFAQLLLGSVMLGVMGVILWGAAGAAIAANRYNASSIDSDRASQVI